MMCNVSCWIRLPAPLRDCPLAGGTIRKVLLDGEVAGTLVRMRYLLAGDYAECAACVTAEVTLIFVVVLDSVPELGNAPAAEDVVFVETLGAVPWRNVYVPYPGTRSG